ncbi:LIC_10740 family protein [Leptospira sp. GIMC2001]|uniref:LIC_10740 family protein n=1 Tax=Leptospira sp. GIMC2001 TaxID=1513297 RepID=UPI0023495F9E|nr:hypothetical protein [Leptospira sp. GIMC2001]WCL48211.1 hypothetical protein O4O04_12940 [Leptospira sp. GIMC2001]
MAMEKNKINKAFKDFWIWIQLKWKNFYEIAIDSKGEVPRKFLFLYTMWISFIIFISFSFLVDKNPFRLLIPFQVFALPISDPRVEAVVYVSDGESQTYLSVRKVLKVSNDREDILKLIEEVGRPPYHSKMDSITSDIGSSSLKKLPNLSVALLSSWIIDDGKVLVLDFSSREIEKELSKYRYAKSRGEEMIDEESEVEDTESYYSAPANFIDSKTQREIEEKKIKNLNLALSCISQTIKANFPKIQNVMFRIDGKNPTKTGLFASFADIDKE